MYVPPLFILLFETPYSTNASLSSERPKLIPPSSLSFVLLVFASQEMFGLSIIMTTPPRTRLDVDPFLEQAVLTYQSRGTLQLDAMRSTLLYYEGYRTIGEWRSVGTALLRAAGEVSSNKVRERGGRGVRER